MPVLTLENACLAYGHVALLDHAALQVDAGERIALIGRNGSGKSSLLRVLAGAAQLDDGLLWRASGLRVAYVPQEPDFAPGQDVFQAVAAGMGEVSRLLLDYHEVSRRLAQQPDEALLERLSELQARLEQGDGWRLNTRVEQALSQIGLSGEVQVDTLSGGGIKRVALAHALVSDPDLLLLDEPTNHLDIDGILWLEKLITDYRGSVIVVTHDRRFLDAIASRVVELDRGHLVSFPGSFARYSERKAEMLAVEATRNEKFDKLLAQEEVWIRKGIEARRTRNEGRVRRLETLRRERAARRTRLASVNLALDAGERSGKLVAELVNVSKSFESKTLIRDFSCRILRGDKIGLIGPNGAGKSTLLKLILGELQPDAGTVRLGTKLAAAYFDQFRAQLDEEASLIDTIGGGADFVEINGERKHVISYLEDFLFAPARARSPVKSLSGGERNRLLLARLFTRPANVLVLDEPTNDLDIETLELLEELLANYDGTLFLGSHDRAFLDNVVTQVIAFEGVGKLIEYAGGYEDWVRVKKYQATVAAAKPAAPTPPRAAAATAEKTKPADKLSFREARELEELPKRIEALEREQSDIAAHFADGAIFRNDPKRARQLQTRGEEIEAEVSAAMARWEELERR